MQYQSESLPKIIEEHNQQNKPKPQKTVSKAGVQYPWAEISTEYITGYVMPDPKTGAKIHVYPTLDELAAKYGCSPSYIKVRSAKESWSKRREVFQLKRREKTAANTFNSVLSESASSDARTLLAVDKLYALVEAYFEQYENMEMGIDGKYRLKDQGYSESDEEFTRDIKVSDLKGLVEVLDKAQALVRRTVGEPVNGGVSQYQDLIDDDIYSDTKEANLDAMINKRNNVKKTTSEVRKEIEQLQKELEENS